MHNTCICTIRAYAQDVHMHKTCISIRGHPSKTSDKKKTFCTPPLSESLPSHKGRDSEKKLRLWTSSLWPTHFPPPFAVVHIDSHPHPPLVSGVFDEWPLTHALHLTSAMQQKTKTRTLSTKQKIYDTSGRRKIKRCR